MISFCIPFRETPERQFVFETVVEVLKAGFRDEEIVVGDNDGDFNRSAARNEAASKAGGDMLVFVDADTLCPAHQIWEAVNAAELIGWAFPYDEYASLTEKSTYQLLIEGGFEKGERAEVEHIFPSEATPEPAVGGMVAVTRESFDYVGGYDERFIGWGFEDRAFAESLSTMVYPTFRVPGRIDHLWHPAPESERFGQPFMEQNRALWIRYQGAAGDLVAMQRIIDERK